MTDCGFFVFMQTDGDSVGDSQRTGPGWQENWVLELT